MLQFVNTIFFVLLRGKQTINLCVVEGGPLPFSEDILSAVFTYGNRVFTEYPQGMVDFFKNSCPAGYTWQRSLLFEDGAVCTASADITVRYINSLSHSKILTKKGKAFGLLHLRLEVLLFGGNQSKDKYYLEPPGCWLGKSLLCFC